MKVSCFFDYVILIKISLATHNLVTCNLFKPLDILIYNQADSIIYAWTR